MRQVSRSYSEGDGEPEDWRQRLATLLAGGVLGVLEDAADERLAATDAAAPAPAESPGTSGDGG